LGYSIVPVAAESLRRLLALATDGGPGSLGRELTAIDVVRDEHGRSMDEPRHPDLALADRRPCRRMLA
jgi:hypothetical protein